MTNRRVTNIQYDDYEEDDYGTSPNNDNNLSSSLGIFFFY